MRWLAGRPHHRDPHGQVYRERAGPYRALRHDREVGARACRHRGHQEAQGGLPDGGGWGGLPGVEGDPQGAGGGVRGPGYGSHHEFVVQDMPVSVAVDVNGNSVHATAPKIWQAEIGKDSRSKPEPRLLQKGPRYAGLFCNHSSH